MGFYAWSAPMTASLIVYLEGKTMKHYITVCDYDGVDEVFPDVEAVAEYLRTNAIPRYAKAVREWLATDMTQPCFVGNAPYTDAWTLHNGDYEEYYIECLSGDRNG